MTSQQSAATDGDAGKGKKKKKGWVSNMAMHMNMERRDNRKKKGWDRRNIKMERR